MSRNRIIFVSVFILGLFLGFLIGGALVYHQYEDLIKGKEVEGRIDKLLQKTEELIYLNKKDDGNNKLTIKKNSFTGKKISIADSIIANDEHLNELLYNLEKNPRDSNLKDSLLQIVPEGSDDPIIIKKDVLLESRKVQIVGYDASKGKKSQYLDSLLTDDVVTKGEPSSLVIEFWESPLNYKGYKMNKTKLVLFGLSPSPNVSIKKINNDIYLEYDKRYYSLILTNEYSSYRLITNEQLIKQLRL